MKQPTTTARVKAIKAQIKALDAQYLAATPSERIALDAQHKGKSQEWNRELFALLDELRAPEQDDTKTRITH